MTANPIFQLDFLTVAFASVCFERQRTTRIVEPPVSKLPLVLRVTPNIFTARHSLFTVVSDLG